MLKKLFYFLISLIIFSVQIFSAGQSPLSRYYDTPIISAINKTPSMTIRMWNNSLMAGVIDDMKVFDQQEKAGILQAHNNFLYKIVYYTK